MSNVVHRLPTGGSLTNVVATMPNLSVGKMHVITVMNTKPKDTGLSGELVYWELSEGFTDRDYLSFAKSIVSIDPEALIARFLVKSVEKDILTLIYDDEPSPRRYFFDVTTKEIHLLPDAYH